MSLKSLVDLLDSLFSPDGLQRFVHLELDAEKVVQEVDFKTAPARVFYEVAVALRQQGRIDSQLFAKLRGKFPRRVSDIDAVAIFFGEPAAPSGLQTHVITLEAAIAGQISAIDEEQIRVALGTAVPVSRLKLDLHDLDTLAGDPSTWSKGQVRIRESIQQHLRDEVLRSGARHLSLFGLAPIPWLVAFGLAVSETIDARVFQRLRAPAGWSWQPEEPELDRWSVIPDPDAPPARDVAVLISASASVKRERVDAVLPRADRATYEITLADPRIDAVRSEALLEAFAHHYRAVLGQIEARHPGIERLHIFAAAPVAVAIECGRRILHNAAPRIVSYEFAGGQYRKALEL
ncbi:SAVED domain-containing protein [Nannocystis pusilla]|uniref:SAVED domain-containing protein n=1 Tax=Nannocystis pusilla TaxID=889268 RepID=A0A9X3EK65_9BACT|nr:SAVED domain-containing protein [Nannocystis pusilla]MCY1004680.1 SAVED domain-containing protein [Nannocystis pusilla]